MPIVKHGTRYQRTEKTTQQTARQPSQSQSRNREGGMKADKEAHIEEKNNGRNLNCVVVVLSALFAGWSTQYNQANLRLVYCCRQELSRYIQVSDKSN